MAFARFEKNGQVAFSEGSRILRVPSEKACRERLIKLLEEVGGDTNHDDVKEFWLERSRETGSSDDLIAAWAAETFERLNNVWKDICTPPDAVPPPAEDVFSAFGFGGD